MKANPNRRSRFGASSALCLRLILRSAGALLFVACSSNHVLPPDEKVTDAYCAKQMGPDDGCGACVAQCGYCYEPASPHAGQCLAPGGPAGSNQRPASCVAARKWVATSVECPGPPPLTGPQ
jgi:hypothetical protein